MRFALWITFCALILLAPAGPALGQTSAERITWTPHVIFYDEATRRVIDQETVAPVIAVGAVERVIGETIAPKGKDLCELYRHHVLPQIVLLARLHRRTAAMTCRGNWR